MSEKITVSVEVNAPAERVWEALTEPEHVVKWNNASGDWHTPNAENDFREGGSFLYRMEAKDGSAGFDFGGTYTAVVPQERFAYTMSDGREVEVTLAEEGNGVRVTEAFDPENENSVEMQRAGWQSILDNLKRYVESNP